MNYNHTQTGYLIIYSMLAVILIFGSVLINAKFDFTITLFMIFILLLVASFSTLNVRIDKTHIRIKFGYGLFRTKFLLKEIVSAKAVRNKWYFGWGIRVWFWPKMIIYNVSGFDAVEIHMKNKNVFRIGTDKPKELEAKILEAVKIKKKQV